MEDVTKELQTRQRIQSIYTKTQADFDSKEAFDDYLEAVEDIIYKLTYNVEVAEVEQQVQDYIRQQAVDGLKDTRTSGAYVYVFLKVPTSLSYLPHSVYRLYATMRNFSMSDSIEAGSPTTTSAVIQPQPLTAVQMDAEGRIIPAASGPMSREKWKLMAQASGWRQEIATQRALQDAFTTVFAY